MRKTMIDINDICPPFSFVLDKGFVPGAGIYRPQEFGNASLVMESSLFSLRLVRDRGQVFMDNGNDTYEWYKLEYVLEYVDSTITQQQFGEPPSPSLMAGFLQKNWDNVVDLFRRSINNLV